MLQKKLTLIQRKNYVGIFYVLPWLFGFLLFQVLPIGNSLYYSFTRFNLFRKPVWLGLENYITMFTQDHEFGNSLWITVRYALFTVPLKLLFSLIIALILNTKVKYINFYRTIYYMPSIFGGSVAIAILWRFLFSADGVINTLLGTVGLPQRYWLGDTKTALYSIGLISIWQFGSSMVIFLAALKQVPNDLYEAIRVDGAGKIRSFFSITLPFLTPMILFNLVMQSINALQEFTGAFVVTNGGPVHSTYVFVMKIYEEAFLFAKMGYAAALSWILFLLIALVTAIIFKFSSLWVFYGDEEKSK